MPWLLPRCARLAGISACTCSVDAHGSAAPATRTACAPAAAPSLIGLPPRCPLPQAELLTRLRWAVRLDFATEVAPSRDLLFAAPRPGSLLHAAAAAAAAWGPCQAAQGAAASTGAHATAGASSTARQPAQPQPSRPPALLAWVPELERLCLAIAQHAAVLRAGPEQPPKRRRFI